MSGGELPVVLQADVFDDQQWFADHPGRQYRLRSGWAVRRRSRGVFLRVPMSCPVYADEAAAERVGWESACPDLDPKARDELAKAARRYTKTLRAGVAPSKSAGRAGEVRISIPIVSTQKRRQR